MEEDGEMSQPRDIFECRHWPLTYVYQVSQSAPNNGCYVWLLLYQYIYNFRVFIDV